MKAITLTQPWATLVAIRAKRIETRDWGTGYRGPIAIHAAKGLNGLATEECPRPKEDDLAELCNSDPFAEALDRHVRIVRNEAAPGRWDAEPGLSVEEQQARWRATMLPRGSVIAIAWLGFCGKFPAGYMPDEPEASFGNFGEGRWGWRLDQVRRLWTPIPYQGKQKLWDLPDVAFKAVGYDLAAVRGLCNGMRERAKTSEQPVSSTREAEAEHGDALASARSGGGA